VNHLPIHRHVIPFILGEGHIPFLPWTFIIYISVFLQGILVIRRIPKAMLRKILPYASGVIFVALIIFLIFPVEYPRMLYTSDNLLISLFRLTDGPGNCFPSLHVAITVLLSFCYMLVERSTLKRVLMWLWSIAVCISVLTTKQHYLIDIFGGIAITLPCMYILGRTFHLFPTKH